MAMNDPVGDMIDTHPQRADAQQVEGARRPVRACA